MYFHTMSRVAICLSVTLQFVFVATSSVQAVSYDFNGTLSSHFSDVPGFDPLVQSGGALNYHNDGISLPDDEQVLASTSFSPFYNQSWSASIDLTVPASYDTSFTDDLGVFDGLGVGIVALFGFGSGGDEFFFDSSLEVNEATGRVFFTSNDKNDTTIAESDVPTTAATATLTLSFDSATKVLSAIAEGSTLLSVDIDAPGSDWGMSDTDQFTLGLNAFSENEAVPSFTPLTLDNFVGTIIPEPSGLLLGLLGVAGMGSLSARSRRDRAI